ncbi:protein serrate [Toxorhynchites rutilus septentrionalis]|uniref:protein serrate n=1 Tax=Toxorhynchites rutilus septentrionalis TaxID=329112 RepID=UPI002479E9DF|nr:protein serrate [Toxorhynchites rutilus septentrionalis]
MGIGKLRMWTGVAIVLTTMISMVSSSGFFEMQILEIANTNSHLLSGYCCGLPPEKQRTQTTGCPACATAFSLCLKEYQGTTSSSSAQLQQQLKNGGHQQQAHQRGETLEPQPSAMYGCAFGNASTPVLGGSSFVLSDSEVGRVTLPFTFRWTKSFTLILQALDMYNESYQISERLIEETSFSGVILPSHEWNTLDHTGKNARITYRVRVQCADNYYNTTCTTFCRPRNDQFGHYTCGEQGNKVCLPGWQGANCEKAICKPGCDQIHGKCDQPGECECRPGWRGPLCNECMVYPGCRHGYCNGSAWQCICDTNWGGILCDQDLNYCGTHEPCMHGGTCENTAPDQYRCTCAEGLSGTRCEIVEHPCAPQPCKNGGSCSLTGSGSRGSEDKLELTTPVAPIIVRGMRGMSSMGKPYGRSNSLGGASGGGGGSGGSNAGGSAIGGGADSKELLSPPQPLKDFVCTCTNGWTGPTCEINIDECAEGPCQNGGTCIDMIGKFRCECPPQWTGETCSIDVDECESNVASGLGPCINAESCRNLPGSFQCSCLEGWGGPTCAQNLDDCVGKCKNGATCIDLVNDYHCACAAGYTGRDCSTDINECANFPCRNGGECVDLIGNFKCICPLGYSGTLCEEAKDHCTSSPCIEGRCLNTPGGYYCHCPPGRAGRHCEFLRTPCASPPCSNDGCTMPMMNETAVPPNPAAVMTPCSGRGKCESTPMGSNCVCQPGFTGSFCQHNVNECISNPCKNNGICIDEDADFSCECQPGWTGKTCAERAVQCMPGQCLNGGSCVLSPISGISQCRCAVGWGGPFCNEPVDQCQGQPCHNGGTCESGPGWFRCLCARGFSGPDCRINVNECSPQPCLGGATCKDGIGGFTCICPVGRRGVRCEILLSDPSSVCSNTTTNSPYDPLVSQDLPATVDESNCNSCVCTNGKPRCSNLWCGLNNCLNRSHSGNACESHQVCVPAAQESCISPPCTPRGDCRTFEPSRRVAPPRIPAPIDCWPNQATLGTQCARVSILLEIARLAKGTSVDGMCHVLRLQLGEKLIKSPSFDVSIFIVLLCDIKTGTNDTIEVTLSTPTDSGASSSSLTEAVRLLAEILSRQQGVQNDSFQSDVAEAAPLTSILEVKVETALINETVSSSNYLIAIGFGIAIVALCLGAFVALIWRQRLQSHSGSGTNLSPHLDLSRGHEEEKSNNLQNEENFRRYANPLKGSASSLRGAMELSLNPAPEINQIAGPSTALHRSQQLYPSCGSDAEYEKDPEKQKAANRNSHILLHKTQNADITKNIVSSIESQHKDFGKRSINDHTSSAAAVPPPAATTASATAVGIVVSSTNVPTSPSSTAPAAISESDVLTVHV